jgi:Fe-S-cluster containining protein
VEVKLSESLAPVAAAMREAAARAKVRLATVGDGVPCRAGCNHCCSRLVTVSLAEATVMREHLVRSKRWAAVRARAAELEQLSRDVDSTTWFTMNVKCPVLNPETGTCEAYDVRPPACSVHFVLSSPSSCDPWSTDRPDYIPMDMSDLFDDFSKTVERKCGGGFMSLPLPMPMALLVSEKTAVRSGLTLDEVISVIARNA